MDQVFRRTISAVLWSFRWLKSYRAHTQLAYSMAHRSTARFAGSLTRAELPLRTQEDV